MHSSRMCTARSLTVSHAHAICHGMQAPPPCMPPTMHAPMHILPATDVPPACIPPATYPPCMPPTMHAPLPCMPPAMHTSPPCMPSLPRMLPPPCTAPYHAPLPAMHAPSATHAPCGQTHTCKNITFANFVCGQYLKQFVAGNGDGSCHGKNRSKTSPQGA